MHSNDYDGAGNKVGESWPSSFMGTPTMKHYDGAGQYTGETWTEQRAPGLFTPGAIVQKHYGADGQQTGESWRTIW